jgi:predicted Zn-dependent protease
MRRELGRPVRVLLNGATNVLQTLSRVEEAVVAARNAQALDPLSPMRNYAVGQALYFARRYDEAEVHLQRLRELYPDFPLTYIYLAQMASLQGRHAAAIAAAEKAHAHYVG